MKRNFEKWFNNLTPTIVGYDYYVDFEKINQDLQAYRKELVKFSNIVGDKNISEKFKKIYDNDKQVLKILPSLLAVRNNYLQIYDNQQIKELDFKNFTNDFKDYNDFFEKTGLKDWLKNKSPDYVLGYYDGVQAGSNTNARKNRTGFKMEKLVEKYIQQAGYVENKTYFKQIYSSEIYEKFGINLNNIQETTANKRFDFGIIKNHKFYAIEVNFYTAQGSKLNEVSRSYEKIYLSTKTITNFEFIWITDGINGWKNAKNNLKEAFKIIEHLYSINELKNGVLKNLK